MQLFKTLLAGAALVASVVAQGQIAFTSFPTSLQAGKPFEIKWTGGTPGQPVTITLRKGPSDDLKDVAVLTSSATGGSYTFTPSTSLVSGKDYALQISQGGQINYSNQFPITGGTGTPSSTSATTTGSSTASSGEPTKPATKPVSTSSQASHTVTHSTNHTTMMTMTSSGTASMGTGTTTSRNTTMVTPTLTSTRTPTLTPTTSPTPTGNAASSLAAMSSPLALVMAALAAFAYLN
ncbi:hypothetical protein FQN49_001726 [Arthroderma sp. PD_2]|nr:hypothetical protein FQN49_001726 [Arthroderma sp. PD_2]